MSGEFDINNMMMSYEPTSADFPISDDLVQEVREGYGDSKQLPLDVLIDGMPSVEEFVRYRNSRYSELEKGFRND